jgi:transposase InsO family protein
LIELRGVLAAAGVKCLRLPARSPDLNSVAERFVLSIKSECSSKLVPLGESHLRRAVSEYVVTADFRHTTTRSGTSPAWHDRAVTPPQLAIEHTMKPKLVSAAARQVLRAPGFPGRY